MINPRSTCLALALTLFHGVTGQSLSASDVDTVTSRLQESALLSWELGTRAQALLELNAPDFSVFTTKLPPATTVPSNTTSAIAPVFSIAKNAVSGRAAANKNAAGPQPLMGGDGSAADPASIGVAVLIANWTGQGAADGQDYAGAARDQINFLYSSVPRTMDGAISHRTNEIQLWSDFVYMVPPFLAMYGVVTSNSTHIAEAYKQIKLYRNYLLDTNSKNLWKHIVMGSGNNVPNDEGHWSTGNGWAAAGMLRVLATMKNSQYSSSFSNEQKDLASWVKEIHTAMFATLDSTNIFTNYADKPVNGDPKSFYDAASTTLIASTVYRFALVWNDHTHLPNAEKVRKALYASGTSPTLSSVAPKAENPAPSSSNSPSSGVRSSSTRSSSNLPSSTSTSPSPSSTTAPLADLAHFTNDGWLTPVVNPHSFGQEGQKSAEGQAFVLELQASYKEWVAGGSVGANAGNRPSVAWALLTGCAMLGSLMAFA
ncbi:glycoside hydrolase family 105 protein [Mycena rebaudengoi]|nr:glycoside hydrolase family 105 protein [Mycena rebaudengoi]